MQVENQTTTPSAAPSPAPTTATPAASPAPAAASSSQTATQPSATLVNQEGGEGAPAAYQPNYKFKVLDKELEIDEFLRGAIKDADTEKKVRELYEKAHGLDHIKADRQTVRQELQTERSERTQINKSLETLSHFVRTDNMQAFFDALKIPEEKVLRYAYNRLQYQQMTPEQRAQVDGQTQAEQRAFFLQQQNESLLQNFAQTAEQSRRTELDMQLSRPDISQAAQAFDARVGKPGAFVEEVINRGKYHWFANQKDIPAAQAIAEVMSLIGGVTPPGAAATAQNGVIPPPGHQAGLSQAPGQTPQQKPIIPNIRGNGNSPAKQVPRSIDDLRKLAAKSAR